MQSLTVPSSRVSRECHSPRLRSPPLKNSRNSQEHFYVVVSGGGGVTEAFTRPGCLKDHMQHLWVQARINGVSQKGGQSVVNQIPWNPVKVQLESAPTHWNYGFHKRGQRKWATSNIVKRYQDKCRYFATIFAQGKKRQKLSVRVNNNYFSTLFDIFCTAPIFCPL